MNLNYRELLPANFDSSSRVWVYQCNRLFLLNEALQIEELLKEFIDPWHSHGQPVKGYGNLFFGQFIILLADESATGISGCSTDESVRFIKKIEQLFKVDMFDRQLLAFLLKDKIQLLPLNQIQYALSNNFISPYTLYFNNLVQTKQELENNWIIPLRESWLGERVYLGMEE